MSSYSYLDMSSQVEDGPSRCFNSKKHKFMLLIIQKKYNFNKG